MAEYIENPLSGKLRGVTYEDGKIIDVHIRDTDDVVKVFAPVRHGRWIHTEEQLGWKDVDCMECSACHDSWIIEEDYCFDDMPLWNYCPSCGAKMDGGVDCWMLGKS